MTGPLPVAEQTDLHSLTFLPRLHQAEVKGYHNVTGLFYRNKLRLIKTAYMLRTHIFGLPVDPANCFNASDLRSYI